MVSGHPPIGSLAPLDTVGVAKQSPPHSVSRARSPMGGFDLIPYLYDSFCSAIQTKLIQTLVDEELLSRKEPSKK
jgi:hypothetical protein